MKSPSMPAATAARERVLDELALSAGRSRPAPPGSWTAWVASKITG